MFKKFSKLGKRVTTSLMSLMVMSSVFCTNVFANNGDEADPLKWKDDSESDTALTKITEQVGVVGVSIADIVTVVGNVVGFIILLVYGIKWWTSAGNSSARKELKEKAVDYVIGAALVFGATWLYPLVHKLIQAFGA